MTLSRWRRVATGIAAGVIVLCAALVGASFRDSGSGVSVASELRTPSDVIAIPEDDDIKSATDEVESATTDETPAEDTPAEDAQTEDAQTEDAETDPEGDVDTDAVRVIEEEDLPAEDPVESATDEGGEDAATTDGGSDEAKPEVDATAPSDEDADPADDAAGTDTAQDATTDTDESAASADDGASESDDPEAAPDASPAEPESAPLTAADDALGTGGGVSDAECALDRLVIYAGARRGGVAGQIRSALAQAGFGAGCSQPVTVLASNCPLQFAGVLGAGSGYDPNKSYVAASDNVDRETMTAVMGEIGYAGSAIDILDFGFVNADRPGEQWIAIFIPPNFSGWENLASRAGLAPTNQSLCAPSGELAG